MCALLPECFKKFSHSYYSTLLLKVLIKCGYGFLKRQTRGAATVNVRLPTLERLACRWNQQTTAWCWQSVVTVTPKSDQISFKTSAENCCHLANTTRCQFTPYLNSGDESCMIQKRQRSGFQAKSNRELHRPTTLNSTKTLVFKVLLLSSWHLTLHRFHLAFTNTQPKAGTNFIISQTADEPPLLPRWLQLNTTRQSPGSV